MKCLEASVLLFSIPKFSQTHSPRLSELEGSSDTRSVRCLTSQDSEGACCAGLSCVPLQSCGLQPPGSSVHGLSRQEHWSGLPFPSPGNLLSPGTEPVSTCVSCIAGGFLSAEPRARVLRSWSGFIMCMPLATVCFSLYGSRAQMPQP